MARVQSPPILSQIRVARTYSEQNAGLRALKDDVIGHVQRKEHWIGKGILEPLVKNLQTVQSPSQTAGANPGEEGQPRPLADDDLVRLQSLQLLASFANGGPSFLAPLNAARAIPAILSHLAPLENPPQVVLTALRALGNITDATRLACPGSDDATLLSEALFRPEHLESLYLILTSESTAIEVQEQKCLVAGLISRLCKGAQQQNHLVDCGILDALATALASFVVLRGEVIPGAEGDSLADLIPRPAPRGLSLALVLEAISTIIADSRFRSCMLVCSPAIMAVFPPGEFSPPTNEIQGTWNALEMSGLSSLRTKNPGAMDYLLPIVPIAQPRVLASQLREFPPLGFEPSRESLASTGRSKFSGWDPSHLDSAGSSGDVEVEDPESPMIPWLIHLVRQTDGLERVMAASVLASLYKAGLASPEREAAIGTLIVPLLRRLIKEHDKEIPASVQNSASLEPQVALDWAILERTPDVLARLIADSEYLQQAAYDCGAMKMTHKLLKDSYEPMPTHAPPRPWSPSPDGTEDQEEGLPTCRVGPPGQLPIRVHKIKMRESVLRLITGLVAIREDYRKLLAELEAVPYIVESLSVTPGKPASGKERSKADKSTDDTDVSSGNSPYGINSTAVIIAACHVMRILGRSVSNLRTYLDDNAVAKPIFKLLRHPDAEVQIAASAAVCNLVTPTSPMRESLLEAGVLKALCEHAHSLNPGLRLNAMWGLKTLVLSADNDLKRQALEEVEPGWLVRLICDETEDEALNTRTNLERRESGGYDDDMDTDPPEGGNEQGLPTASHGAGQRYQSQRLLRAQKKAATLRDAELNPARKARNDDLAIQEQALNFIRNMMSDPSTPDQMAEMVDLIFSELGQERLFQILASKLRVKVLHPFARKNPAGQDTRVLYPQAKVVEVVIIVLVHISASIPRHRQLVISQTDLLKLLGGHMSSHDMEVRRALVQLAANLSWQEDDADKHGCQQRSQELRKLGFLAKLEELEEKDADLEVREKAKAASYQLKSHHI